MEEYRGGLSAWERCYRKINQTIYQGSRYADRMPIGDPEIIQNAPYEAFTRFYHDWYHPANLAIAAVGDFDPDAIEAIIRKYFGPIPARENPRPLGVFPLAENIEPLAVVAADPEMNMTMLTLKWKHPVGSYTNQGEYLEAIKINIFSQMLSDRCEERSNGEFSPFSYGYAYKSNMAIPSQSLTWCLCRLRTALWPRSTMAWTSSNALKSMALPPLNWTGPSGPSCARWKTAWPRQISRNRNG
jgi:zinc protease